MRDSDWSRPNLLRCDWLPIIVAIMTTQLIGWTDRRKIGAYSIFCAIKIHANPHKRAQKMQTQWPLKEMVEHNFFHGR